MEKVCKKHQLNPARIYGQCIGCELEALHNSVKVANLHRQNENLERIRAERDRDEARQANAEKLGLLQRIKAEMDEFGRLVGVEIDTTLDQKAEAYNTRVRGLEQANAALLEGLKDIATESDDPESRYIANRLLTQYDTAPKEDKTNDRD